MISKLEEDWQKYALIIKRSWFYWLYSSMILVLAFFIMLINVVLAYHTLNTNTILMWWVIWFLIYSMVYAIYSSSKYLIHFKKVNWTSNRIETTKMLKIKLKEWDDLFIKFFNQATLNYFLFILLIIINIVNFFFSYKYEENTTFFFLFGIIDIAFLFLQSLLIQKYRKKMIDLEMDFNVVIPWKIFFVNQSNMISNKQEIDGRKIKTIKSSYPSKLLSFFKVGNIEILTEWDANNLWAMSMYFVTEPDKTVTKLMKILENDIWNIEEFDPYHNPIFNELLLENWISIELFYKKDENVKKKVKDLFKSKKVDNFLKKLYTSKETTEENKNSIVEIYTKILT